MSIDMTTRNLITAAKYFWLSMAILNGFLICLIRLHDITLRHVEVYGFQIPDVYILELGLVIMSLAFVILGKDEQQLKTEV
jgi:hypothetical protein